LLRADRRGSDRFPQISGGYALSSPRWRAYTGRVMRPIYFLLGWCFFGLGAVGTVVPGLPTTPFMLLALWAFSKSSQRFHDWLYAHRLFGPPLQQWRDHGVISARAKLLALVTMLASLLYLLLFTGIGAWIKVLTGLLMLYGAAFILSKPSRPPAGRGNEPL
jgi:uncharacterized membrane protein YbaN (DUF454 family)